MASVKFTSFSAYLGNGRRVKFQTSISIECESNGELIITDGGVAGVGSGVPTCTATIEAATCVAGHESTQLVFDRWKAKESIDVTFGIVDGRILHSDMWAKNISFKGDPKAGTTSFSATLQGGEPETVG
jgi:hypothetical protein